MIDATIKSRSVFYLKKKVEPGTLRTLNSGSEFEGKYALGKIIYIYIMPLQRMDYPILILTN